MSMQACLFQIFVFEMEKSADHHQPFPQQLEPFTSTPRTHRRRKRGCTRDSTTPPPVSWDVSPINSDAQPRTRSVLRTRSSCRDSEFDNTSVWTSHDTINRPRQMDLTKRPVGQPAFGAAGFSRFCDFDGGRCVDCSNDSASDLCSSDDTISRCDNCGRDTTSSSIVREAVHACVKQVLFDNPSLTENSFSSLNLSQLVHDGSRMSGPDDDDKVVDVEYVRDAAHKATPSRPTPVLSSSSRRQICKRLKRFGRAMRTPGYNPSVDTIAIL